MLGNTNIIKHEYVLLMLSHNILLHQGQVVWYPCQNPKCYVASY